MNEQIDQYEGWNREMLLNLIRELTAQAETSRAECSAAVADATSVMAEARAQIASLEARNGWRALTVADKPFYFESFLLEWDGLWQRATMLGAVNPAVRLYWHGREDNIPFDDLIGRRWMRIPALPKEAR